MKTIFEACEPRAEVLSGELREEIFAARLRDVIEKHADPVYQDPDTFFANTYPTEGLKLLLEEALGRLTGERPSNNAIIRLETAFGGGKTHNLIGLYHLAVGNMTPKTAPSFVPKKLIPKPGAIKIAGVVGSDLNPSDGLDHGDARTYTLWGELAYQLKGAEGYKEAAQSDRDKAAPGTALFEKLIGDEPTLMMLDEIGEHLRVGQAVPTATGKSNLAEQTVAFLMALLEFASSKERVVVALTLASSTDAFGKENEALQKALAEASSVTARKERVITPTGETELSAIVTHRLFEVIDKANGQQVAQAYLDYYRKMMDQKQEIPDRAVRAEYVKELEADYPFHPEFLSTLNRKTSTIPNFQKTRGALRLLALVIRRLWEKRPANAYLIHADALDLTVHDIINDLTSRLQRPTFAQVVEADIASPRPGLQAHAQVIDADALASGKPPYAGRAATTVFLHSLTQGMAAGVDPADLNMAVLRPGDAPILIRKALEALEKDCWFFEWDGNRFRFKTEPALNKIVADEMGLVGRVKAKEEADRRIKSTWKSGVLKVKAFPQEAADLDDDSEAPKLALIHYDAAMATSGAEAPPDLVAKLFDRAGTADGFRRFRNNVLFLAADQDLVDNLVTVAQRYLAIGRILGDADRMSEFSPDQRDKLKKMQEAAEIEVRVAVTKAYRYLFYPSADAPQKHSNLARETLPPQEQGEVKADQTEVVLRVLKNLQKTLSSDDTPLAAAYVKSRAWDKNQDEISTEDLRQAFAKKMSLRILLDPNQLKRTIRDGITQGIWLYYDPRDGEAYGAEGAPPAIQLSSETFLLTPEAVKRKAIAIRGQKVIQTEAEERCPVCGNPKSQCICGDETPTIPKLKAEGAPAQALQRIVDQAADAKVKRIRQITVSVEGMNKEGAADARALGLAIPQIGKGNFKVYQQLTAEFGTGETLTLTFNGGWDRYKRLKQVTDPFGQEANKLRVVMKLVAEFPEGLDPVGEQFGMIRDILTSLKFGKLTVEAEGE